MSILDKSSLVMIPSGYKEDKLYSVKPRNGEGDFTFTRASTGTRVNADGYIEEVPWNLSTNSQPTSGVGFQTGVVFQQTDIYDWNGVYYGDNTVRRIAFFPNTTIVGQPYTFSVFVKLTDGSTPSVGNSATDDFRMWNGAATTDSLTITDLGNGIFRCSVVRTATSTTTNVAIEKETYNSAKTFEVSGYQLNKGTSVKPYIKTTDRLDIPRLDYSGGANCPTLLLEGQRTNLVTDSNANFIINQCTIAYNDTTSPEGITNAYKATATGTSGSFVRTGNVSFANPSAFSVFLKYGNNQWVQIIAAGNVTQYVNVDIQNGTFGTNGSGVSDLLAEDYGNGWYRISGKFSGYSGTSTLRVYMGSTSNAGWAGATAIVGNYYYGYGFQVESNASYATSYIPTSGTSVTRIKDLCIATSVSDLIGQTEGVVNLKFQKEYTDTYRIFTLYGTSTSNRLLIFTLSDNLYVFVTSGGVLQFQEIVKASMGNGTFNIAVQYKQNDYKVYVNGVSEYTNTSANVPASFEDVLFAQVPSGNFPFNHKIDYLYLFKETLTDSELETLTTL